MTTITRFAPSPTGLIHIGNIRTALICYLIAKQSGGKFMLRLDDTDLERSKEEYAEAIKNELKWLGLDWDILSKQSDRLERYEEVKQKLIDDGRLYPCYETAEELDVKRKTLINRGKAPIYDRGALKLTEKEKMEFEVMGRKPHWRFKLDQDATISWDDKVRGRITFEAKNLTDPVLIRENGSPTYMLPSTVDDIDFGITDVVRGEDHVSNTAIQIQIFEALGAKVPNFAHNSLMKGKDGKISKREGGFDIASLREDSGIEPMAIVSLMARLGTSAPVEPKFDMNEVIKGFDISTFSKSAAIYDFSELEKLNPKIIHLTDYGYVKDREVMKGIDEDFWLKVRPNLNKVAEISDWWEICKMQIEPVVEDQEFLNIAKGLLPEGEWDETTWGTWTNAVKEATGRKGKDLFMPIRQAITARSSGPELKVILPLIGHDKVSKRLSGQVA